MTNNVIAAIDPYDKDSWPMVSKALKPYANSGNTIHLVHVVPEPSALGQFSQFVPKGFAQSHRKEAKDHGEAGLIVGSPLVGNVLIVDDAISAGTSVRESVGIINAAGANPMGVAIALDRQERGQGTLSASQEAAEQFGLQVLSIATLSDLIALFEGDAKHAPELKRIQAYRGQYGV